MSGSANIDITLTKFDLACAAIYRFIGILHFDKVCLDTGKCQGWHVGPILMIITSSVLPSIFGGTKKPIEMEEQSFTFKQSFLLKLESIVSEAEGHEDKKLASFWNCSTMDDAPFLFRSIPRTAFD